MKINQIFRRKNNQNESNGQKERKPLSAQTKNYLQYLPLIVLLIVFLLLYMPKNQAYSDLRSVKAQSEETLQQINNRIVEQENLMKDYDAEMNLIELNSDQWYINASQSLIVRDVNDAFEQADLEYEYLNFSDLVEEKTETENIKRGKLKFYTELNCNLDELVNLVEALHGNLKSVSVNIIDLSAPDDDDVSGQYSINLEVTLYTLINNWDV